MIYAVAVITFFCSLACTGMLRHHVLKRKFLDLPNERSSHQSPTPRGGGLAIVLTASAAFLAVYLLDFVGADVLIALLVGGGAVALVGFLDDLDPMSPFLRLAVHFVAAVWALGWLGGLPPLSVGATVYDFAWGGYALGVLGIVWTLNLFNFMDGIDGIAASEATFIPWAAAFVAWLSGDTSSVASIGLVFGAACCGFLVWNWQPAKVFMGDVGSGYLGYVIAVFAVAAAWEQPGSLFVWWILGGVFFVDATATFLRRLLRRERVYEAHRTHAYQWLARRWRSHQSVTTAVLALNLIWVLPCAWLAAIFEVHAVWIAIGSMVPLAILAIAIGAGKSERSGSAE